jgi:hypothetical protein
MGFSGAHSARWLSAAPAVALSVAPARALRRPVRAAAGGARERPTDTSRAADCAAELASLERLIAEVAAGSVALPSASLATLASSLAAHPDADAARLRAAAARLCLERLADASAYELLCIARAREPCAEFGGVIFERALARLALAAPELAPSQLARAAAIAAGAVRGRARGDADAAAAASHRLLGAVAQEMVRRTEAFEASDAVRVLVALASARAPARPAVHSIVCAAFAPPPPTGAGGGAPSRARWLEALNFGSLAALASALAEGGGALAPPVSGCLDALAREAAGRLGAESAQPPTALAQLAHAMSSLPRAAAAAAAAAGAPSASAADELRFAAAADDGARDALCAALAGAAARAAPRAQTPLPALAGVAWALAVRGSGNDGHVDAAVAAFDAALRARLDACGASLCDWLGPRELVQLHQWHLAKAARNALSAEAASGGLAAAHALECARAATAAAERAGLAAQFALPDGHADGDEEAAAADAHAYAHLSRLGARGAGDGVPRGFGFADLQPQHRGLSATLRRLGLAHTNRAVVHGYAVDVAVAPQASDAPSEPTRDGAPARGPLPSEVVLIDLLAPGHYVEGSQRLLLKPKISLKHEILRALGHRLVALPYWEWRALRDADGRAAFVQRALGDAVQLRRAMPGATGAEAARGGAAGGQRAGARRREEYWEWERAQRASLEARGVLARSAAPPAAATGRHQRAAVPGAVRGWDDARVRASDGRAQGGGGSRRGWDDDDRGGGAAAGAADASGRAPAAWSRARPVQRQRPSAAWPSAADGQRRGGEGGGRARRLCTIARV